MAADLMAGVVLVALIAYALFGGADFGGGFWSAFAFGPRREQVREAIFRAMGPVWETNHVWLILVLVALWTGFPPVFSALFEDLFVPLSVALLGIVFRGAAFAFRHYGEGLPATGLVFSVASTITPFAMGVCAGAVIDGRTGIDQPAGAFEAWLQVFPMLCGVIAVLICAFLTPFYMLGRPLGELTDDFRRMAFVASLALGAATALAIPVALAESSDFADRLLRPVPLLFVAGAVVMGLATLVVLKTQRFRLGPTAAAATVFMVMAAWGVAQYPYILLPGTRIEDVAAGDATLEATLIVLPIGALILVPSLVFLYSLFAREAIEDIEAP